MTTEIKRCDWCLSTETYRNYHDNEWGTPQYDDAKLFEFLLLETMQAGLSWITILNRRDGYRNAFAKFEPEAIATYDANKIEELMANTAIIRNRKKIEAAITNAQQFLEIQSNGTFADYLWGFTNGEIIKNAWHSLSQIPAKTPLSDKIALDLKKRGFKFVGSVTIYAYLQAVGVVNDHLVSCFKYNL